MRLYEGTVQQFKEDVINNKIADLLKIKFEEYYKRSTNPREFRALDISLGILKEVLDTAQLLENKIIIELKQWSNDKVKDSEDEGNVIVDYGNFTKLDPHPCLQAEGYYWHLKDYMTLFEENNSPLLSA